MLRADENMNEVTPDVERSSMQSEGEEANARPAPAPALAWGPPPPPQPWKPPLSQTLGPTTNAQLSPIAVGLIPLQDFDTDKIAKGKLGTPTLTLDKFIQYGQRTKNKQLKTGPCQGQVVPKSQIINWEPNVPATPLLLSPIEGAKEPRVKV